MIYIRREDGRLPAASYNPARATSAYTAVVRVALRIRYPAPLSSLILDVRSVSAPRRRARSLRFFATRLRAAIRAGTRAIARSLPIRGKGIRSAIPPFPLSPSLSFSSALPSPRDILIRDKGR